MKCLIVFVLFVAFHSAQSQSMTKEERVTALKNMANDCATKEGASADDIAEVLAKKVPSAKGGKCIHACIGESIGIVSYFSVVHFILHFHCHSVVYSEYPAAKALHIIYTIGEN